MAWRRRAPDRSPGTKRPKQHNRSSEDQENIVPNVLTSLECFLEPKHLLPVSKSSEGINLISGATLTRCFETVFQQQKRIRLHVVDARFPFEYDGGHIRGARLCTLKEEIDTLYSSLSDLRSEFFRDVIVFHCEFSSKRAPRAYRHFRSIDRRVNQYPHLSFPELYVLEGGYCQFFSEFRDWCTPSGYVSMWDEGHLEETKASNRIVKLSWKSRQ